MSTPRKEPGRPESYPEAILNRVRERLRESDRPNIAAIHDETNVSIDKIYRIWTGIKEAKREAARLPQVPE